MIDRLIGEICFALPTRCSKNRDAIVLCGEVLPIPSAVGEYLSLQILMSGM